MKQGYYLIVWTTLRAAEYQGLCSGQEKTEIRQGVFGVGLAAKELICRNASITHEIIDVRLMSMRFELASKHEASNFRRSVRSNKVCQGRRAKTFVLANAG